jgi:FtsH-binding integral membrane protein
MLEFGFLSMPASRSRFSLSSIAVQLMFVLVGVLLTGFLTVFFARFLQHYLPATAAVPLGVGLGVSLTLWFTQWMKHPPFLLSGTSPLIAGVCAALGVHVSRVWL